MLKSKKNNQGFTIIEVMIVLAIAGLILLIVFLAVPALQRNSRNTQRKNDVSALLGAVNEYTSNNGGALPTNVGQVVSLAKTGYYSGDGTSQGNIDLVPESSAPTLDTTSASDRVVIVTGATCSGSAAAAGASRQVAVLYDIEASSGFTPTCQSN
ncbi:MAG TPA: type II secretion system protein [Candidatus Saccharimonadales bacterium]|nr:type II secretion system protein [Candidatus Saccharimonadales bacterium]